MIHELQQVEWEGDTRPECPGCGAPTAGLQEKWGKPAGSWSTYKVVLVVTVPCGCDVTDVAQTMMQHNRMKGTP